MFVYLVIRETKWKIPCSYDKNVEFYETETDVISAHRNVDDAIRMVDTQNALETNQDVRYYWDIVNLI